MINLRISENWLFNCSKLQQVHDLLDVWRCCRHSRCVHVATVNCTSSSSRSFSSDCSTDLLDKTHFMPSCLLLFCAVYLTLLATATGAGRYEVAGTTADTFNTVQCTVNILQKVLRGYFLTHTVYFFRVCHISEKNQRLTSLSRRYLSIKVKNNKRFISG